MEIERSHDNIMLHREISYLLGATLIGIERHQIGKPIWNPLPKYLLKILKKHSTEAKLPRATPTQEDETLTENPLNVQTG